MIKSRKKIKNDNNYKDAQNRLKDITKKLAKEKEEEARNQAENKNYTLALSNISQAISYAPDDKELTDLKEDYSNKKLEQDKKRAEEEIQKALLTKGKS